ncbi:MAG: hypothetical protein ACQEP1_02470 [Nanobdellota archaeon]
MSLDSYIEDHLRKYIKFHLEQGYSYEAVKRCLLKYGYSHEELDRISKGLKYSKKTVTRKYSEKELDDETYLYLRGMISEYLKKQLDHGFHLDEIRKALINFGHKKKIVDDAVNLVTKEERLNFKPNMVFAALSFLTLLFIAMMSLTLGVTFKEMFLVLSPAVAVIALSYFYTTYLKNYTAVASLLGVIIIFMTIFPHIESSGTETHVLLVMNAVIGFIVTGVYSMVK